MKSGNIIYYLFQKYPNIFFELIDEPFKTAARYQFSSVAIASTKTQKVMIVESIGQIM